MKETPAERKVYQNFKPGKISKDGFIGNDTRHIHDIIEADQRKLDALEISAQAIADRLQFFINEGKKGLETVVDLGDYRVQVRWSRGAMPCPFGERGVHSKIVATVENKKLDQTIRYSQLNVHMIREHVFFEGEGSTFRLDPVEIVRFLELEPDVETTS